MQTSNDKTKLIIEDINRVNWNIILNVDNIDLNNATENLTNAIWGIINKKYT